ncbi:MAG TPA: Rnf-Nqr domain containing protein, partial [Clostridia bacterium]|nr:Rnf-Nqr domain containing protein [Clostridia bacterium]
MRQIIFVIMGTILVENFVLQKFLGVCPFLGVSKKMDSAVGMSGAVVFVMTLASAVTWAVNEYLLVPNELTFLQTIAFILVVAALVQFVEIILKRFIKPLYKSLGIYLPLITTNCAVLGVAL